MSSFPRVTLTNDPGIIPSASLMAFGIIIRPTESTFNVLVSCSIFLYYSFKLYNVCLVFTAIGKNLYRLGTYRCLVTSQMSNELESLAAKLIEKYPEGYLDGIEVAYWERKEFQEA